MVLDVVGGRDTALQALAFVRHLTFVWSQSTKQGAAFPRQRFAFVTQSTAILSPGETDQFHHVRYWEPGSLMETLDRIIDHTQGLSTLLPARPSKVDVVDQILGALNEIYQHQPQNTRRARDKGNVGNTAEHSSVPICTGSLVYVVDSSGQSLKTGHVRQCSCSANCHSCEFADENFDNDATDTGVTSMAGWCLACKNTLYLLDGRCVSASLCRQAGGHLAGTGKFGRTCTTGPTGPTGPTTNGASAGPGGAGGATVVLETVQLGASLLDSSVEMATCTSRKVVGTGFRCTCRPDCHTCRYTTADSQPHQCLTCKNNKYLLDGHCVLNSVCQRYDGAPSGSGRFGLECSGSNLPPIVTCHNGQTSNGRPCSCGGPCQTCEYKRVASSTGKKDYQAWCLKCKARHSFLYQGKCVTQDVCVKNGGDPHENSRTCAKKTTVLVVTNYAVVAGSLLQAVKHLAHSRGAPVAFVSTNDQTMVNHPASKPQSRDIPAVLTIKIDGASWETKAEYVAMSTLCTALPGALDTTATTSPTTSLSTTPASTSCSGRSTNTGRPCRCKRNCQVCNFDWDIPSARALCTECKNGHTLLNGGCIKQDTCLAQGGCSVLGRGSFNLLCHCTTTTPTTTPTTTTPTTTPTTSRTTTTLESTTPTTTATGVTDTVSSRCADGFTEFGLKCACAPWCRTCKFSFQTGAGRCTSCEATHALYSQVLTFPIVTASTEIRDGKAQLHATCISRRACRDLGCHVGGTAESGPMCECTTSTTTTKTATTITTTPRPTDSSSTKCVGRKTDTGLACSCAQNCHACTFRFAWQNAAGTCITCKNAYALYNEPTIHGVFQVNSYRLHAHTCSHAPRSLFNRMVHCRCPCSIK